MPATETLITQSPRDVAHVAEPQTARQTSIGVVICAYTEARWAELEQAVHSVQRQSRPARELVVVIDHNDDLFARAQAEFRGITVVANAAQPGLSGARNTGISHVTSSSVVAFLDDDANPAGDWLEALADTFDDERVIGVGGWISPRWEASEPRWLAPELYWIVGCSYRGLPPAGDTVRNPIGANMAFRRAALVDVGGFPEGVGRVGDRPVGDEETQLGIEVRALRPEARIVHVPAARVEHFVSARRATWRYVLSRCWHEGRSKAMLTGAVGSSAALASERTYVARVLPAGFARGLKDALRGEPAGLGRAASIAAALAVTATGYISGRARLKTVLVTALVAALAGCSTAPAAVPSAHPDRKAPDAQMATPKRLVWSDEFDGPAGAPPDPTKWRAVTGPYGAGTHELEYYTSRASNVALDGQGHLVITARRETYSGHGTTRQYTSGRIETGGLFQTTYGELDARIKIPAGQGLWPAFWALGSDYPRVGWPGSGEIDMMEALGNNPFTAYGTIHGPSSRSHDGWSMTVYKRAAVSLAAGYHVYGVHWSPGSVVFTLDGVPYAARTRAAMRPGDRWVLNKPFYLLLNLAVGGVWPGNPNPSTPFPAQMLVDWVRVYS